MRFTGKKFAFTLSEVLITLGIIGAIAALTMPTVNHRAREQEQLARFKSVYSKLESALQSMDRTYSCFKVPDDTTNFPMINYDDYGTNRIQGDLLGMETKDCTKFYDAYLEALGGARRITTNKTEGPTPELTSYLNNFKSSNANGGTPGALYSGYVTEGIIQINILKDGTFLMLGKGNQRAHNAFLIDTNGTKGPNRYGQDVFSMAPTLVEAGRITKTEEDEHGNERTVLVKIIPKKIGLYPVAYDTFETKVYNNPKSPSQAFYDYAMGKASTPKTHKRDD